MSAARRGWVVVAAWCAWIPTALVLLIQTACTTAVPVADRTLAAQPPAWVAIVPRAVRASPEFARLLDARKGQYKVEVIEYDPDAGTPVQRLALVQSSLDRVGAGTDEVAGYVLLVGGPATLPMGPWRFEGLDAPLLTDFPLGAALDMTVQPVPAAAWHAALERSPRWLVGRIPYDEAALAVRMMGSACEQMQATGGPHGSALLGAGDVFAAWAMANSRGELRKQGWTADLVGHGGSCDAPAPGGILPAWDRRAPQLVVMAAHAEPASNGGGLQHLLPGASARDPVRGTAPALMVVFASGFGAPDNQVLRSLFEDRWAAGGVAFAAPTDPAPLGPAWRLAVHLPTNLASGAPLGNSAEAARRMYWAQAGRDIGMIFPSVQEWRMQNALSLVVYGDPALRSVNSAPPPTIAADSVLPLVLTPDEHGPTADGGSTALDSSSGTPTGAPSAWPKWLALGALLVFLLTVSVWMLARRK